LVKIVSDGMLCNPLWDWLWYANNSKKCWQINCNLWIMACNVSVYLCICIWRLQWLCGWQFCGLWVIFQSQTLLLVLEMLRYESCIFALRWLLMIRFHIKHLSWLRMVVYKRACVVYIFYLLPLGVLTVPVLLNLPFLDLRHVVISCSCSGFLIFLRYHKIYLCSRLTQFMSCLKLDCIWKKLHLYGIVFKVLIILLLLVFTV